MSEPSMGMVKDELLAMAESKGLKPDPKLTKAELIELINSVQIGVDPAKPGSDKTIIQPVGPKPEKQAPQPADKNEALQKHPKFDKFKSQGEINP